MSDFDRSVEQRSSRVAVIGLGYVGLPLAISFAEAGFPTIGFDVSKSVVDGLNDGRSHIDDVEDDRIAAARRSGGFSATNDASSLRAVDVVFICVPTPFDRAKTPDLSFVRSATETLAANFPSGCLVILQSTTYPGTTAEFVRPILERGGLVAGVDFHLAFSPERVDPGNATWGIRNTPKVVGGLTPECTRRSVVLLRAVMDTPELVHAVSSPAIAEMSKLLENTYRAVNIAFVNELAQLCERMGIDVWEVIGAARTKPFGFQAFFPGIGPGGHCIPVDPHYLAWKAREYEFQMRFVELAADVNSQMADYAVGRLQEMLNRRGMALSSARVLCLGAAFKSGVSDVRNSRAIHVMELLRRRGAAVSFWDPMVGRVELDGEEVLATGAESIVSGRFDVALVLVASPDIPHDRLAEAGLPVFDAVNAGGGRPNYVRL